MKKTTDEIALGKSIRQEELMADRTPRIKLSLSSCRTRGKYEKWVAGRVPEEIDNKESSMMQIIEEHKLAMETRVKAEREAADRAAK